MPEQRQGESAELCPECRGRGMIRPPGEWHNEVCPTCYGSGHVPKTTATASTTSNAKTGDGG